MQLALVSVYEIITSFYSGPLFIYSNYAEIALDYVMRADYSEVTSTKTKPNVAHL